MSRRLARELALKILYWYESGNGKLPMIIPSVLDKKKYANGVKSFCQNLVERTVNNLPEIDKKIVNVLKNWKYNRIAVIDKLILRLGTCEILYFEDIPYEVIINEAIEISKKYSDEESPKFINGILDAIAKAFRKESSIN